MKMKILFWLILIISIVGCDVDNYVQPNAKISGKVVDNATNAMIENGGVNSGTIIELYEGDATQPITSYSFPDGRFVNAALFEGDYRLVARGPFKMIQEEVFVTVTRNTENVEVKVLPNVRLTATIQNFTGTSATIRVDYEKVPADQTLQNLAVVWSKVDNPNMVTTPGGGSQSIAATPEMTEGSVTFEISGLASNTQYYFRAAGITSGAAGYHNYSKTVATQ
jgi:hypothetical protein